MPRATITENLLSFIYFHPRSLDGASMLYTVYVQDIIIEIQNGYQWATLE